MKVWEAIEVLKNMNQNSEVNLTFSNATVRKIDPHDPDGGHDPNDPYDACMRAKPPVRNLRC